MTWEDLFVGIGVLFIMVIAFLWMLIQLACAASIAALPILLCCWLLGWL